MTDNPQNKIIAHHEPPPETVYIMGQFGEEWSREETNVMEDLSIAREALKKIQDTYNENAREIIEFLEQINYCPVEIVDDVVKAINHSSESVAILSDEMVYIMPQYKSNFLEDYM